MVRCHLSRKQYWAVLFGPLLWAATCYYERCKHSTFLVFNIIKSQTQFSLNNGTNVMLLFMYSHVHLSL